MDQNVLDAIVTDYQYMIPVLNLPDPDDRHVLAAAIHSHASVIVTFNLKDFPQGSLSGHCIESQHPDDFIANLHDLDSATVCAAVRRHRAVLKAPAMTVSQYLEKLESSSLPQTAAILREHVQALV